MDDVPAIRAFMPRVFQQDYGYGYQPRWLWDYDDVQGVYLDNSRHMLFVVADDASREVVGTVGIRSGGPKGPGLQRCWSIGTSRPGGPPGSSGGSSSRHILGAASRGRGSRRAGGSRAMSAATRPSPCTPSRPLTSGGPCRSSRCTTSGRRRPAAPSTSSLPCSVDERERYSGRAKPEAATVQRLDGSPGACHNERSQFWTTPTMSRRAEGKRGRIVGALAPRLGALLVRLRCSR